VDSTGKIEDCRDSIHVDFANRFPGGGVLQTGCVQEEIRFTVCPECIITMVLCERLSDQECIMIVGTEQFSSYSGYGRAMKFAGDYVDPVEVDELNHRKTAVWLSKSGNIADTCIRFLFWTHWKLTAYFNGQRQQSTVNWQKLIVFSL
jgi:hypothetical protein